MRYIFTPSFYIPKLKLSLHIGDIISIAGDEYKLVDIAEEYLILQNIESNVMFSTSRFHIENPGSLISKIVRAR